MRSERLEGWTLALAVGVVLADSAIVTLALPDILRELGAEVGGVAWVLIAFNAVLALAVVPAALMFVGGRRTGPAAAAGVVVFAAASAACALAPSLEALILARVAQALGGALVIAASLELLVAATGSGDRGLRVWVAAGVAGTAIGPVAGGLLTEAFSWQSIFAVQVSLVLLAIPAVLRAGRAIAPEPSRQRDRPDIAPNLALAMLSAALTAALFLLVLLLVEGWQRSPALAALTVSVVPVAALLAQPLARVARADTRAEAIAGSLLVAGGLTALAYLPAAEPRWTLAPQALVGLGLGLTIDSLTRVALQQPASTAAMGPRRAPQHRNPRALHGAWTICARHAGIVLGLALLTPVFTADLRGAKGPVEEAIAAEVLDSGLSPRGKLALADGLGAQLGDESGRVPDLGPAFERARLSAPDRPSAAALEGALDDQLERAATRAFRDAFLLGALLALVAVLPALALGRRP